jgi:hypothetical protein
MSAYTPLEYDDHDGFSPSSADVVRALLLEGERAGAVTLALRDLIRAALQADDAPPDVPAAAGD